MNAQPPQRYSMRHHFHAEGEYQCEYSHGQVKNSRSVSEIPRNIDIPGHGENVSEDRMNDYIIVSIG